MTDQAPPAAEPLATIGHNSAGIGEMLSESPAAIFNEPDTLKQLVAEIEADIEAADIDLESKAGRSEIASRAHKISGLKASIEKAGTERTAGLRAEVKKINTIRDKASEALAELRDKARKPLNEWEAAEADRKAHVDGFFRELESLAPEGNTAGWEGLVDRLKERVVDPDVFGAKTADAIDLLKFKIEWAEKGLADAIKAHEDAVELERLRKAEREREAREAEAAAEARRKEAEAVAEKERAEAEARRVQEAADAAAANAAREAEEAAQAERDRIQAEADAALEAERKAKAEAEAELAAARERERQREEADAAAKAEADRKAADTQHRQNCRMKAITAVMEIGCVSDAAAADIVTAIQAGNIPHVTFNF